MLNILNLLATGEDAPISENILMLRSVLSTILIVLMAIAALTAIVLVMLQPGNSTGIDALGGSSETFFGKNKGKSVEAQMKKWTWVCLVILAVLSIVFYILQNVVNWSAL